MQRIILSSIAALVAMLGVVGGGTAAAAPAVRLPFKPGDDGAWIIKSNGLFEGWIDHRELAVLHHPWVASESNHCVTVSREIQIPANWSGQARLGFYISDDYFGEEPPITNNWLGQIKLVGHRFKQVLAGDEVIWERDVADHTPPGNELRHSVLLPERIKPGDKIRIAFRLIDKVASSQRLPEDHLYIGTFDNIKPADEWKFKTDVFVGDVILVPEATEPPSGEDSLTARAVKAVHEKRWPLKPYGETIKYPVFLTLEQHESPYPSACPIQCGVPLAAGMARDVRQVILSDPRGNRLPLQAKPMNTWSDGSLRWVELDVLAPVDGHTRKLRLDINRNSKSLPPLPAPPAAIVSRKGNEVRLQGHQLEVVLRGDAGCLVRSIRNGTAALENLAGEIEIAGKVYHPITETTKVLAEGPIRAEVELSGQLKGEDPPLGRFVFRLAVFAGQPFVRLTWRIFNDRAETLRVSRFELLAQNALASDATARWGSSQSVQGSVCLRQPEENSFEARDEAGTVIDKGAGSAGWLAVGDIRQTVQILVRHFRQQFPKALEFKPGQWRIALFEPAPDQPFFEPTEGEAKRHEIWLGLWNHPVPTAKLEASARYFTRPARLFNADYFCASGAFGYAAPHNAKRFPDFHSIVTNSYGDISASNFYVNGIRNWGDLPYSSKPGLWCNGYYNVQQSMASEYLMSGQPPWYDHLEAIVRHIMDIDICHASATQPDWVGSIHCGHEIPNHTGGGPWCPTQRTFGTLAYWRLSGDLDARAAALGVADSVVRTKRGIGSVSVRDHAGILYCLTAAYDETQDRKYLAAARELAHDAMKRIDRRRGCYPEIHGNVSYQGNVPWMCAQLAEPMYYYYRQSGDVEAAIAVVGLAESILTEDCNRNVPGDVFGYSHNPRFAKTSSYHVLIAPTIFYAYELTGDEFYLKHARGMWKQMIKDKNVNGVRGCYWLSPTLLYYAQLLGL